MRIARSRKESVKLTIQGVHLRSLGGIRSWLQRAWLAATLADMHAQGVSCFNFARAGERNRTLRGRTSSRESVESRFDYMCNLKYSTRLSPSLSPSSSARPRSRDARRLLSHAPQLAPLRGVLPLISHMQLLCCWPHDSRVELPGEKRLAKAEQEMEPPFQLFYSLTVNYTKATPTGQFHFDNVRIPFFQNNNNTDKC